MFSLPYSSIVLLNYQAALKVVIVNDLIYCTGKKLRLLFYDFMMRIEGDQHHV
jgi:hypothetical protein